MEVWQQVLCKAFFVVTAICISIFHQIIDLFKAPNELHGKLVVITGAAQGIGLQTARLLALKKRCQVVLVDIMDKVKEAADEITSEGGNVRAYIGDVTKRQEMADLAKQIESDAGRPADILFVNAGVLKLMPIESEDEQSMQQTFNVNVFGALWTYQAFLPSMKARKKGHIVTTASLGSFIADGNMTSYSSSKSAVRSIAETLRQELRQQNFTGIKTSIIYPFFVSTPLIKDYLVTSKYLPLVTAEQVAQAVVTGIEYEHRDVYVPGEIKYLAIALRLFHNKAMFWLRDRLDTGFKL